MSLIYFNFNSRLARTSTLLIQWAVLLSMLLVLSVHGQYAPGKTPLQASYAETDINLNGHRITNGYYVGDGSGLTNLSLSGGGTNAATNTITVSGVGYITVTPQVVAGGTNYQVATTLTTNSGNASTATSVVNGATNLAGNPILFSANIQPNDGNGLTNIAASNIVGTILVAQLPAAVVTNNSPISNLSGILPLAQLPAAVVTNNSPISNLSGILPLAQLPAAVVTSNYPFPVVLGGALSVNGVLTTGSDISAGGNVNLVGNVNAAGNVSATGNVSASGGFYGNGAFLTGVPAAASNLSGTINPTNLPPQVVTNTQTRVSFGTVSTMLYGPAFLSSGSVNVGNQIPGPFPGEVILDEYGESADGVAGYYGSYPNFFVGCQQANCLFTAYAFTNRPEADQIAAVIVLSNYVIVNWTMSDTSIVFTNDSVWSNQTGTIHTIVLSNRLTAPSYPGATEPGGAFIDNAGNMRNVYDLTANSSSLFSANTALTSVSIPGLTSNGPTLFFCLPATGLGSNINNNFTMDGSGYYWSVVQTSQYTNGLTPTNCLLKWSVNGTNVSLVSNIILSAPIYGAFGMAWNKYDGNIYIAGNDFATIGNPNQTTHDVFKVVYPTNTTLGLTTEVAIYVPPPNGGTPNNLSFMDTPTNHFLAVIAEQFPSSNSCVVLDCSGSSEGLSVNSRGDVGIGGRIIVGHNAILSDGGIGANFDISPLNGDSVTIGGPGGISLNPDGHIADYGNQLIFDTTPIFAAGAAIVGALTNNTTGNAATATVASNLSGTINPTNLPVDSRPFITISSPKISGNGMSCTNGVPVVIFNMTNQGTVKEIHVTYIYQPTQAPPTISIVADGVTNPPISLLALCNGEGCPMIPRSGYFGFSYIFQETDPLPQIGDGPFFAGTSATHEDRLIDIGYWTNCTISITFPFNLTHTLYWDVNYRPGAPADNLQWHCVESNVLMTAGSVLTIPITNGTGGKVDSLVAYQLYNDFAPELEMAGHIAVDVFSNGFSSGGGEDLFKSAWYFDMGNSTFAGPQAGNESEAYLWNLWGFNHGNTSYLLFDNNAIFASNAWFYFTNNSGYSSSNDFTIEFHTPRIASPGPIACSPHAEYGGGLDYGAYYSCVLHLMPINVNAGYGVSLGMGYGSTYYQPNQSGSLGYNTMFGNYDFAKGNYGSAFGNAIQLTGNNSTGIGFADFDEGFNGCGFFGDWITATAPSTLYFGSSANPYTNIVFTIGGNGLTATISSNNGVAQFNGNAATATVASNLIMSTTGIITVNGTNAASGQVLTATDGSGHVAFAPASAGGSTNALWVSSNGVPFSNPSTGIPMGDIAHTYTNNLDLAIQMTQTNGGTIFIGPCTLSPISLNRLLPFPNTPSKTNWPGTNTLSIIGCGPASFVIGESNYYTFTATNGASIIQGPFEINRPNVHLAYLSIDSGQNVCSNLYGGSTQDGLDFYTVLQEFYTTNTINAHESVSHVSVLGASTNAPNHCLLFENTDHSTVEDVWLYMNQHGLVIKGYDISVNGVHSAGHYVDSVIIKANDYAAPGLVDGGSGVTTGNGMITINGIVAYDLVHPGDTAGLMFDASQAVHTTISSVSVCGYVYTGTNFFVNFTGGSQAITGISVYGMQWNNTSGGSPIITHDSGVRANCVVNGTSY